MPDPQHDDESVPGLEITRRRDNSALIITVSGEIDVLTAPALQAAIHDGLEDPATGVCVVDLTKVTFLGSHGLSALLKATEQAQRRREPLRIVVDSNRPVIRPIEVTGLDHLLALYHSVEDALAAGRNGAER